MKLNNENSSSVFNKDSPKTQATPEKSVISKAEERNPYRFIEKTLNDAKQKLDKMKGTPQLIETLQDVSV